MLLWYDSVSIWLGASFLLLICRYICDDHLTDRGFILLSSLFCFAAYRVGHFETSRVLDATTADKCSYVGQTNAEVLSALDPRLATYSMSYVYDNFEYAHCTEDFEGLFDKLYGIANSGTFAPTTSPTRKPTTVPTSAPTAEEATSAPTMSPDHTYTPTTRPTHRPSLSPVATATYCSRRK